MPCKSSTKKNFFFFDITNPGLILVLWDILVGLPISYFLTHLNAYIFRCLGYEKFMRSPGGVRLSQSLFALINIWLVVGWAWQLMQEAKERKKENLKVIREEIAYWDGEIEILRVLRDTKHIKDQFEDSQREGSESGYVQEKRMVIVDGKVRWRKGIKQEPVASTQGNDGLVAWKKSLREPSMFYGP